MANAKVEFEDDLRTDGMRRFDLVVGQAVAGIGIAEVSACIVDKVGDAVKHANA